MEMYSLLMIFYGKFLRYRMCSILLMITVRQTNELKTVNVGSQKRKKDHCQVGRERTQTCLLSMEQTFIMYSLCMQDQDSVDTHNSQQM